MRYFFSFALFMALGICCFSDAFPADARGGFTGPVSGASAENAAEAKNQPAGARVVLSGHIISRLAGARDDYMFQDASGKIQLVIPPKLFRNLYLTPDDKVRVSGRVQRDKNSEVGIDVKVLEVIRQ